jgi:hypothetical protein
VGILDGPNNTNAPRFTVTHPDGTTWDPPSGLTHTYSIDAGVLTVFPVNAAGDRQPGARHYSPTGWTNLIEHDASSTAPACQQINNLVT